MNKHINKYIISALCLLLMLVAPSLADETIKLKIAYDNQAPYRFTNSQGRAEGIDIARISAILDQAGIEYEFQEYPWKRILRLIQTGEIDLGMGAGKLEEREDYAWFSDEVFKKGSNVLVVKQAVAESFVAMSSLSSLRNMDIRIGVRRGMSYSDEYESLLSDPLFTSRLVSLTSISQAIELTSVGRISGLIAPPKIIEFEAMKACINNDLVQVYDLLVEEDANTYVIYSKKTVSPETVSKIDVSMRKLNSDSAKFEQDYVLPTFDCKK